MISYHKGGKNGFLADSEIGSVLLMKVVGIHFIGVISKNVEHFIGQLEIFDLLVALVSRCDSDKLTVKVVKTSRKWAFDGRHNSLPKMSPRHLDCSQLAGLKLFPLNWTWANLFRFFQR